MRLLFLLLLAVSAQGADIIPSIRLVDWINHSGVRGGIFLNATQTLASTRTVYTNVSPGTDVISTATQNCPANQVVQLTHGTYNITSVIGEKSGVTIRGMGPWVSDSQGTRIKLTSGFSGSIGFHIAAGYDNDWNNHTAIALTNLVKGSLSITSMVNHGWAVGDRLIIDQTQDTTGVPTIESRVSYVGRDSGNRPYGMIATITNVPSTTTAILNTPLIYAFSNEFAPQGFEIDGWTTNFNIESLTIDALDATSTAGQFPIQAEGWADSWLYDVEITGIYNRGMWAYGINNVTVARCYFNGGRPIGEDLDAHHDSNRGYGIYFGPHACGVTIVDTIFSKLTNPTSHEGTASYLVSAYNLYTNIWWKDQGDEVPVRFGPLMHGPYPSYILIEGNHIEGRARADDQFGSSGWWLWYRNVITPKDRRTTQPTAFQWSAVEVEKLNHMYSFVGNILGQGGENVYVRDGTTYDENSDKVIWETGYDLNSDSSTGHDPNVLLTMLRWMNYDKLQDAISNHVANVGDTGNLILPDSYAFAEKPDWFFNLNWPPYHPSNMPPYVATAQDAPTNIPAGWRYVMASASGVHPNWTNPPAASEGGGGGSPPSGVSTSITGQRTIAGRVTLQ